MDKTNRLLKRAIAVTTIFFGSIIFFPVHSLAQSPGSGGPPVFEETEPEEETPPPTGVPIDGGASLLLAAGAAYGLKKIRDKNKRSRQRKV